MKVVVKGPMVVRLGSVRAVVELVVAEETPTRTEMMRLRRDIIKAMRDVRLLFVTQVNSR